MDEAELTTRIKDGLREMLAKANRPIAYGVFGNAGHLRTKIECACKHDSETCNAYMWPISDADTIEDLRLWCTAFALIFDRKYGATPYFW